CCVKPKLGDVFGLARILGNDHLDRRDQWAHVGMPVKLHLRTTSCQRYVFWNERDRAVQGTLGFSVTAQTLIAPGDLFEKSRVLWIKLDSALKIFGRFGPSPLTSIDIAEYLKRHRIIRQTLLCQG